MELVSAYLIGNEIAYLHLKILLLAIKASIFDRTIYTQTASCYYAPDTNTKALKTVKILNNVKSKVGIIPKVKSTLKSKVVQ